VALKRSKARSSSRRKPTVTPHVAAAAASSALAEAIVNAIEEEAENDLVPEAVVFQLSKLAPEAAIAALAATLNNAFRQVRFALGELKAAVDTNTATLHEARGTSVPFREGMQALLAKVEEAFHTGAEVAGVSTSPSHLTAMMAQLKRHLELEDRAFRQRRRTARGASVNADPTAAARMARLREKKAKAKAAEKP
jgi:hypothetical protein